MSSETYHNWLASILKKAQGHLTDSGREIDVGRECIMLKAEIERLRKELERLEPLQDWIGQCSTFTEAELAQTVTDPDALWVQCPRWILEEYYREAQHNE